MNEQPRTAGFAWHVHHEKLAEWCYDIEERREYIRQHKPVDEQAIRLARLQWVRAKLGDQGLLVASNQARVAYDQARVAYDQARVAYDQARVAYEESIPPDQLNAAHREECPDCPWDGTTMFCKSLCLVENITD